jgi:hypothetical protein
VNYFHWIVFWLNVTAPILLPEWDEEKNDGSHGKE